MFISISRQNTVELISEQCTRGLQYQIVIDSIPIDSNESYVTYFRAPSDNVCKVIAADDFYALIGRDEKTFSAVLGNIQTLML